MKDGRQIENQLYIKNYEQGIRLLSSYYTVMLLIEKNLQSIDLEGLLKEILDSEEQSLEIKTRYYKLESSLNIIMGQLA